jgi:hypothetical protein
MKADVGFFQVREKDGTIKNSMGRLQIFIGVTVGVGMVIFGIILDRPELVYSGIGLIVGEGAVKGVQKLGEK